MTGSNLKSIGEVNCLVKQVINAKISALMTWPLSTHSGSFRIWINLSTLGVLHLVHLLVMAGQNMMSTYQFQMAWKAAQEMILLYLASFVVHSARSWNLLCLILWAYVFTFCHSKKFGNLPLDRNNGATMKHIHQTLGWSTTTSSSYSQMNLAANWRKLFLASCFGLIRHISQILEQQRFGLCTCTLAIIDSFRNLDTRQHPGFYH